MAYGEWTENSRGTYDKWDAISRCTTQVCAYKTCTFLVSESFETVWILMSIGCTFGYYLPEISHFFVYRLSLGDGQRF